MNKKFTNEYFPDYTFAPGETLLEVIEDRGMTPVQLAERMGLPEETINEIIKGNTELTPETAIQLERILGVSAAFWNQLEASYREFIDNSVCRILDEIKQTVQEGSVRELLGSIKDTIEKEGLSSEYLQLMRAMKFIRKIVDKVDE